MQGLFTRPPTSLSEMGAVGSTLAGYAFLWATFSRFLTLLPLVALFRRLQSKLFPEVSVTVAHQSGYGHSTNELYFAVESYLRGAATETADKLKAAVGRDGAVALSLDKGEQVADAFQAVRRPQERRQARQRRRRREAVVFPPLLPTVPIPRPRQLLQPDTRPIQRNARPIQRNGEMEKWREMEGKARKRRLYSNCSSTVSGWNDMSFEHPASVEMLDMEFSKKKRIIPFRIIPFRIQTEQGHRPELEAAGSAVRNWKLLALTGSKLVLVEQDIDCAIQLAGARKLEKPKKKKTKHDLIFTSSDDDESCELESAPGKSEVTLYGLLNLIDSLWSVS